MSNTRNKPARRRKSLGDPRTMQEIPALDDPKAWYRIIDDMYWYCTEELVHMHRQLHAVAGNAGSYEAHILEVERELAREMRSWGIEQRYTDALSQAAGTVASNPKPPSLAEVCEYILSVRLHTGIVRLLQGIEDRSQIFVEVDKTLLSDAMAASLLQGLQRMMPPGVDLQPYAGAPAGEEFLNDMPIYDLSLDKRWGFPIEVVPAATRVAKSLEAPAPPKLLLKNKAADAAAGVRVQVCKASAEERYVLGEVLIPEEEDGHGEVCGEHDVWDASCWWMENTRGRFAFKHSGDGTGEMLYNDEIVVLHSYIAPVDFDVQRPDGSVAKVKAGTWLVGARFNDDDLWQQVKDGELNSWSIGAYVIETTEAISEDAPN